MKKILMSVFLMALIAFGAYYYVLHGGARDLASEETDFAVSSSTLTAEFVSNVDTSNKKYLEKAVAVSGKITSVSGLEVIVDKTIICNLKTPDPSIKKDANITVKGRLVGFDDLLGEIKLDQCFVIKS